MTRATHESRALLGLRGAFMLPAGAGKVRSWGGVRGGVSLALALSIPPGAGRDWVLARR